MLYTCVNHHLQAILSDLDLAGASVLEHSQLKSRSELEMIAHRRTMGRRMPLPRNTKVCTLLPVLHRPWPRGWRGGQQKCSRCLGRTGLLTSMCLSTVQWPAVLSRCRSSCPAHECCLLPALTFEAHQSTSGGINAHLHDGEMLLNDSLRPEILRHRTCTGAFDIEAAVHT